jgi:hypothetical protein
VRLRSIDPEMPSHPAKSADQDVSVTAKGSASVGPDVVSRNPSIADPNTKGAPRAADLSTIGRKTAGLAEEGSGEIAENTNRLLNTERS